MKTPVSRRGFLRTLATTTTLPQLCLPSSAQESPDFPPIESITRGPNFHWFGYYDKKEFDPTDRFVLSNEVQFEHRSPTPDDRIRLGMVDTANNNRWIELGSSRAWGWQQGCMLQWRPGSNREVVWNDRDGDRFVCRVCDVHSQQVRTLPKPIYALSSDGKWAITTDFSRIQRLRRGYGYAGVRDRWENERAPEESGIWRMDMETGASDLIFSLADAARIDHQGESLLDKWNYFNHLLLNTDSSRFAVLHRWRPNSGDGPEARPKGRFTTRLFTVDADGSNRFLLDTSGNTSHFIWRDSQLICAWTKPENMSSAFYLLRDHSGEREIVGAGVMTENGHHTYVPRTDNQWILNDTYPDETTRMQVPYLYHGPSRRKIILGRFHSPPAYNGEWRCDTHPRCNNAGTMVAIDSPHSGTGRQVYLIDIGSIIG